jgi:hypothetical protein
MFVGRFGEALGGWRVHGWGSDATVRRVLEYTRAEAMSHSRLRAVTHAHTHASFINLPRTLQTGMQLLFLRFDEDVFSIVYSDASSPCVFGRVKLQCNCL